MSAFERICEAINYAREMNRKWVDNIELEDLATLTARIKGLEEALSEAVEFADQDYHCLTPAGERMIQGWRDALAASLLKGGGLSDANAASATCRSAPQERAPDEAPGHTDLMVTPESIDAFMEANPLPDDGALLEAMCRAHDREDSAQRGEPSPWDIAPDADDMAEFRKERLAAMRCALDAVHEHSDASNRNHSSKVGDDA